jgi:hypothetical protein
MVPDERVAAKAAPRDKNTDFMKPPECVKAPTLNRSTIEGRICNLAVHGR